MFVVEYMQEKVILQIENVGNITQKPQENGMREAQACTHASTHTHIHTHHCRFLQRVNSVLTLKEYHFFQVPKEVLFNTLMTQKQLRKMPPSKVTINFSCGLQFKTSPLCHGPNRKGGGGAHERSSSLCVISDCREQAQSWIGTAK